MEERAALEHIEAAAMADFFAAAPATLRQAHQIEARRVGQATLLTSRGLQPAVLFRRVLGLDVGPPVTEDELKAVLEPMQALDAAYAVSVAVDLAAPQLVGWLRARGFTPGYAWMKFRRDCAAAPRVATDLVLREAGTAEDFGRVVCEGFGMPPLMAAWTARLVGRPGWCCMLAYDGQTPVAAGAVFVRGEYAWLGFGATLVSHRQRGAQNALLSRRLSEAAARGARVATTETGERQAGKPENSYRNILRCGFTEAYLRHNFMSPSSD